MMKFQSATNLIIYTSQSHVISIKSDSTHVLSSSHIELFGRAAGAGFPTLVAASVP